MYGSSVSSIILPGTLRTIGAYAFSFSDIKEITIPEGVSEICECSFLGCINLASVTFPESLASVGQMAFWDCSSLSEINIPQSGALTNISGTVFTFTSWMNQKQTKSDYVSVNDILIYAGAEDSVIPDNVSGIADNAISLDVFTLRIPDSVKKIEKDSLLYLNNLEEILFEGTEEEWNSIYEQEQDSEEPGYKILFLGEADLSKGDVNGNRNLNIDDASAVLDIYAKQAAGIAAAADDTILTAADVNENSAPDIEDAGAILSYYAQFSADLYPIWDEIIYGPDMKRPAILLKNYGSSVTVEWQPDSQADGYEIY